MTPRLIGLGYRKHSGKDTIADHLMVAHGFNYKLSWADKLKEGVNAWHGWDERHSHGHLKEVVDPYWGYSPREAYQKIGTDLMRNQWMETFWVKAGMRQVLTWLDEGKSVLIPDTRFPNECQAILDHGGEVWQVHRPSLPSDDLHASETALDGFTGWTRTIENDGTLAELLVKVDSIIVPG